MDINTVDYLYNQLEVKNKEELFRKISQDLVDKKIVKENYFEGLLNREREFPTGLPLPVGVAIPHTDSDYVLSNQIIYVTLKNPIEFNVMGGDVNEKVDVSVCIFIVLKDGQQHLQILTKLIEEVNDKEYIKELAKSSSRQEMLKIINNKKEN